MLPSLFRMLAVNRPLPPPIHPFRTRSRVLFVVGHAARQHKSSEKRQLYMDGITATSPTKTSCILEPFPPFLRRPTRTRPSHRSPVRHEWEKNLAIKHYSARAKASCLGCFQSCLCLPYLLPSHTRGNFSFLPSCLLDHTNFQIFSGRHKIWDHPLFGFLVRQWSCRRRRPRTNLPATLESCAGWCPASIAM